MELPSGEVQTIPCDKAAVSNVLRSLFEAKMASQLEKGDAGRWMAGCLEGMGRTIFSGSQYEAAG